jgi:GTPase SAR1 family protein
MAVGNIFNIPVKTAINCSMQSKSIMVVGKSKAGKSTLCAQAPKPIFLMTENGGEALTGFTPVPIASWSDFKNAVTQLCSAQGRQNFDTVVIDTYTNLILLLDKYIGQKLTNDKTSLDFGSDADYGKGTKGMRNELGVQLQKLANQGYLMLNVVHAEDKTDFNTQKEYIGTSLSNSLYGVAEKFVDQIIYLKREAPDRNGEIKHNIYFNSKGGYAGTGGRFTPAVDSVPCSYADMEKALVAAMNATATSQGATASVLSAPSVIINNDEEEMYDFPAMLNEFKAITDAMISKDEKNAPTIIRSIVEAELGANKKVSLLTAKQAELLANILNNLKNLENEKGENE